MVEGGRGADIYAVREIPSYGIPPLDVWMKKRIDQAKQQLEEGEKIDPWFVSDLFLSYHELVTATMMQVHETDQPETLFETRTPQEEGLVQSIFYTKDAFTITAYPYYNVSQQKFISDTVHRARPPKSQEPFTLTQSEKATLHTISQAIDVPDNPHQYTYSFATIPPAPSIVEADMF